MVWEARALVELPGDFYENYGHGGEEGTNTNGMSEECDLVRT